MHVHYDLHVGCLSGVITFYPHLSYLQRTTASVWTPGWPRLRRHVPCVSRRWSRPRATQTLSRKRPRAARKRTRWCQRAPLFCVRWPPPVLTPLAPCQERLAPSTSKSPQSMRTMSWIAATAMKKSPWRQSWYSCSSPALKTTTMAMIMICPVPEDWLMAGLTGH